MKRLTNKNLTLILSVVMAICLSLSAIGFIGGSIYKGHAVETGVLSTAHLSVEKNVFNYGEPIFVTAKSNTAGGSDWVGIRKSGTSAYIRWRYIDHVSSDVEFTGLGSGAIIDLKVAKFKTGNEDYKDIPAGNYEIVFYEDDSEVASEIIPITVVDTAYNGTYLNLKQKDFYEGEILFSHNVSNPGDNDWLAIGKSNLSGSIKYEYVTTAQGRYNIAKGDVVNANDMVHYKHDQFKYLQAGDYQLLYIANGSTVETVPITVHPKYDGTTQTAHLKVNKTVYNAGEEILVTPTEQNANGKDWVGVSRSFTSKEYIRWRYISYATDNSATTGKGSGTQIDIKKASTPNSNNPLNELPAGFYQIYFVPNDGAIEYASEWIYIQVIGEESGAPTNATLKLDNATDGFIDGEITVTFEGYSSMSAYYKPTDVIMYWADENGVKLPDYSALAKRKIKAETTTFDTYTGVKIPENAKKLLVYGLNSLGTQSKDFFTITLPNGCQYKNDGKLLSEFQIVSDIHVADEEKYGSINMPKMLKDIALYSPNSKGIMVAGDMTNNAKESQYQKLVNIYNTSKSQYPNLPKMYLGIGNHEFLNFGTVINGNHYDHSTSAYNDRINRYKKYAKQLADIEFAKNGSAPYFDLWLDGLHFVFLASESIPIEDGGKSYISNEQLAWLDETLAKDRSGKPIFVFVHQALVNTVAGSHTTPGNNNVHGYMGILAGDDYAKYQDYSYGDYGTRCLLQEMPLRNILKKYPEVSFFSGHGHWWFDSPYTMVKGDEDMPITMFNTSSAGYLWQDYNKAGGEHLDGSQGYYVRVYEDRTEYFGRNFDSNTWASSAQFVIYNHVHDYQEVKTETEHYKECSCGDIIDRADHVIVDGYCECGYHVCEFAKDFDATTHFEQCVCGEKQNVDTHTLIDGDCVCGYHEHIYVNGYDEDSHYKECSCGDVINDISHNFTDGECDCGYVDPSYQPPTGDGDEGGDITPPPSGDGEGGSNDGEVDTDIEQQPSTDGEQNNNNTSSGGITCAMAVNTVDGILGLTMLLSAMLTAFVIIKFTRRRNNGKMQK